MDRGDGMFDSTKTAAFIAARRRDRGLTQSQVAERLGFAFRGETYDEVFRGKRYEHRVYALEF